MRYTSDSVNTGENQGNIVEESDQVLHTEQPMSEPNTPLSYSSSNPPTCPRTNCPCKRLLESKTRTIRRLRKSVKGLKQSIKCLKRVS